jgi:hypothetical protein
MDHDSDSSGHATHSSLTLSLLSLSDSLNPSHPAYRLLNLTSRKTALHYSPPSPGQDPMHHLLGKLRVSDHHLLDRRVANHGGLELENFEIQISNANFILGCRNFSRKCKESNGGFSKLRKIVIGIYGIFKINSGAPIEG